MLIGITAPLTRATQLISTVMCEQLNLQHINMRQPVTNALASLLEIDSQTLLHDMDINKILPGWGKSIYTLDKELCAVARSGNAFCFLEYAGQQLEIIKAQRSAKKLLFSGVMITGICTEQETEALRQNGCTLVHLYDYTQPAHNYLNEHDGDIAMHAGHANTQDLSNLIHRVRTAKTVAA